MNSNKLELSTKMVIAELEKRGYEVEVLDYISNLICAKGKGKLEYIQQASITRKDSYVGYEILKNKLVCKKLLHDVGVRVPAGASYTDIDAAKKDFHLYAGKKMVIKPNSTNYGVGVAIVENLAKEKYEHCLELCFELDKQVLVEEFCEGGEYRFLVIDGKTRAILHRVPASVIGDGVSTIRELVEAENLHEYRGEHHELPLQKMQMSEIEILTLQEQGLSFESKVAKGEVVYLRRNSNISTGGYGVDFTDDEILKKYSSIAEKTAKTLLGTVCGVDILIDLTKSFQESYAVIEANFNPALFIHKYPRIGSSRAVECDVLDSLDLK